MKLGFAVGNIGPIGTAENVSSIARHAEELRYDSLWTVERLLFPVNPQTPYPVTPDGHLPEGYKHVLDPLDSLTYAAAITTKIGLGTSVLDIPFYNPVTLARRLTTIDVLSKGRLRVGLGLGWSQDEMDATGAEMKQRGARAEEFLQVLKAIWTSDPAEFQGKFFKLPKSHILPKPVQKPHPPIYMAAFAPAALNRLARLADGWNPVMVPLAGMKQMFATIQQMAKAAGRDPRSLKMAVRANLHLTYQPLGEDRAIFSGSREQVKEDIAAVRGIGTDELFFDPTFMPGAEALPRWLEIMDEVRELAAKS